MNNRYSEHNPHIGVEAFRIRGGHNNPLWIDDEVIR